MLLQNVEQPQREPSERHDVNDRDNQSFTDSPRDESWPRRQEIGARFLRKSYCRGNGGGRMDRVRVGEEQEFATRGGGELMAGPAFADPTGGKGSTAEQTRFGMVFAEPELAHNGVGFVIGIVV